MSDTFLGSSPPTSNLKAGAPRFFWMLLFYSIPSWQGGDDAKVGNFSPGLPCRLDVARPGSYAVSPLTLLLLSCKSCLTLCGPMDCSTMGFLPLLHYFWRLVKFISIESVMLSYLNLCHPLLLLPSIFPSIRVFYNELALPIRWPKYWSFCFNKSPSNEYSGLISFKID